MSNKEILLVVDSVSNEKLLAKEKIFEALEIAIATATNKGLSFDADIVASINRKTGDYKTFRRWEVVENENIESPLTQVTLDAANYKEENEEKIVYQIGDFVEEEIESAEFNRITTQIARHVIIQKVREAERLKQVDEFVDKEGELFTGVVKRATRDNILLDINNSAEAILFKEEMLPRDMFRTGDRVKCMLTQIKPDAKGAQLVVSRKPSQMLIELFNLEVPEIAEDSIEVVNAARDPGLRAKISVRSNDKRIDPVGACVGMRGSRVQAISEELCGEKIDIVLFDDDIAQYVINAMSPAEITQIILDEDTKTIDLAVDDENLAKAIGKNGQNVRLASELTGWTINVMKKEELDQKHNSEIEDVVKLFIKHLDIDEDFSQVLAEEGFRTIEEIAYVPISEILQVDGMDEEIVQELRTRAKAYITTKSLAEEETLTDIKPDDDLLNLQGLDSHLAYKLANNGIVTLELLAEQAVDDLLDIIDIDKELAGKLIMKAREKCWFSKENNE